MPLLAHVGLKRWQVLHRKPAFLKQCGIPVLGSRHGGAWALRPMLSLRRFGTTARRLRQKPSDPLVEQLVCEAAIPLLTAGVARRVAPMRPPCSESL